MFKVSVARMGKVLPSETAARVCVAKLASLKEEQIQELLRDKKIFLIVDEVSGVRRIFQWGVSVTLHRDDASFSDVTAIIMP